MGAVEDYFSQNGWPKTKEEAARAKEVVEGAENMKQKREKCKRFDAVLIQARLLLAAGRYEGAVERLKGAMEKS